MKSFSRRHVISPSVLVLRHHVRCLSQFYCLLCQYHGVILPSISLIFLQSCCGRCLYLGHTFQRSNINNDSDSV